MYLMDYIDVWIFNPAMNKNINKICKLIHSVNCVGNKSCDYKTQGFGLLIKSCYRHTSGHTLTVCHSCLGLCRLPVQCTPTVFSQTSLPPCNSRHECRKGSLLVGKQQWLVPECAKDGKCTDPTQNLLECYFRTISILLKEGCHCNQGMSNRAMTNNMSTIRVHGETLYVRCIEHAGGIGLIVRPINLEGNSSMQVDPNSPKTIFFLF